MTIFEEIIARKRPAKIVYENDHLIAIEDIAPTAPVHLLIITKKVIPDIQSLQSEDGHLLGEVAKAAQELATRYGVADGYRLITNNGPSAGQSIWHLHFHLIGGRDLGKLG